MRHDRLWRLSGGFGAIALWASILIAGLVTPGFSHTTQAVSALGQSGAPHAWILNWIGLCTFGASAIVTALFAVRDLPRGPLSILAALLLTLGGAGAILVGLSPCSDAICSPADSAVNGHHQIGAAAAFLLIPCASLVLGMRWLFARTGRGLYAVSLLLGVCMIVAVALFLGALDATRTWGAIWERLLVLLIGGWTLALSVHMYRHSAWAEHASPN